MKLRNAFAPLTDLRLAIQAAFYPTLRTIYRTPRILLHPASLSQEFMSHVWVTFSNEVDEGGRSTKQGLLPRNASGVVLDVGAGHGHTTKYLDRAKVTKYIALEPNSLMHSEIRRLAGEAGFREDDGTLQIIPRGAEDIPEIIDALGEPHSVDTVVSILTFCSIPNPKSTLTEFVDIVLKPGGQLLFYEHVLSPLKDVAWWQWLWTPLCCAAFGGCCLDRPTHLWIKEMRIWETTNFWGKLGEDAENLWWHQAGKCVKKA